GPRCEGAGAPRRGRRARVGASGPAVAVARGLPARSRRQSRLPLSRGPQPPRSPLAPARGGVGAPGVAQGRGGRGNPPPMPRHRVTPTERLAWERDGFFVRARVFAKAEVAALCAGAERVAERAARAAAEGGRGYEVDGNRYVEAAGATIQFEHRPGS